MGIKRKGRFFVYMVRCSNGHLYTGYTRNLRRRIREHNTGSRGAKSLRGKKPVRLVFSKEYKYYLWAVRTEMRIKRLNKKKKEALIQ